MPSVTELTIDRAKVRRGGIVPIDGCMCPLGHYAVAAGKNPNELTDYRWLSEELGELPRIYGSNDNPPRGAWDWKESEILRHNEILVIAAFKEAGVTVTYTGEYK